MYRAARGGGGTGPRRLGRGGGGCGADPVRRGSRHGEPFWTPGHASAPVTATGALTPPSYAQKLAGGSGLSPRRSESFLVYRSACPSASSRDQEFHGHQGALLDPRLDIVRDTAFLMNGCDDHASSGLIQNGRRPGGHVRVYALLEVEGELRVRQQV